MTNSLDPGVRWPPFSEPQWAAALGLRIDPDRPHGLYLQAIHDGRMPRLASPEPSGAGIFDHPRMYRTSHPTMRWVGISHPYHVTSSDAGAIAETCERFGIHAIVGDPRHAWYGMGTVPILWMPQGMTIR